MSSMPFDYEVLNEDQAMKERYQLLSDGDYPATIKKIEPDISNNGNHMYVVDLDVYDVNGSIHSIRDYWMFSRNMIWKTIHAAESCGLLAEYENKTFSPEVIRNKHCVVCVRTQEGKEIPSDKLNGKPAGSKYPTKNNITDYIKSNQSDIKSSVKNKVDSEFSDDIPF